MSEIEQLRQDIEKLEAAQNLIADGDGNGSWLLHDNIVERKKQLAKLEAEEAAKADRWADAKRAVKRWEQTIAKYGVKSTNGDVCEYVRNLEQRVAELEKQLVSEKQQVDNVDSMAYVFSNDLEKAQARIAELKAELAKRPVVYCMKNNLTGIYGKHFGLDRIALFDIENPEVLAEWQSEPYTGEQS